MIETEVIAPPQRSSRKFRWIAAILVALLIGFGGLFWWLHHQGDGTQYRLVNPVQAVSSRAGPLPVETAPDLAAAGVTADYVQRSSQLNQVAFVRRERHTVEVQVTAGNNGIEQQELSYVLIGPKGEELSKGKLELSTALQPGAKGNALIEDGQIPSAARIVIRK